MTKEELLSKFRLALEESPQAVLATVTAEGFPSMRYMSPAMLKGKEGSLYSVTAGSFPKVQDLTHALVSWMHTNPKTREVISFRGRIGLIEDSRLKTELLEEIGQGLENFWRLNPDASDLVCLETQLVSGEYFNPKTGDKAQFVL